MPIVINMCGIDYEVNTDFFSGRDIQEELLIGDTYFIKFLDGDGSTRQFSIYKDNYLRVMRELKIDKLIK